MKTKLSKAELAEIRARQKARWAKIKAEPAATTMTNTPEIKTAPVALTQSAKSPVVIAGTWDGARHWLNTAKMFEQGKLFAQVMAGFEIIALQKAHGVVHGNNQHEGRTSQNGKSTPDFESILKKETGLSQSTAYRFMSMAKAAAPRLKKLPALRGFDPAAAALSAMTAPQAAAMATAVKKLTDGQTQQEFGEQLGLWKKPQGSGATGRAVLTASGPQGEDDQEGDAEPVEEGKKLTIAQEAELRKQQAAQNWAALDKGLTAYADKFILLPDTDVEAQIAVLEQALKARREWLKNAVGKRDAKAVADLF